MHHRLAPFFMLAACVAGVFPAESAFPQTPEGGAGQLGVCDAAAHEPDQPEVPALLGPVPEGVAVAVIARHPVQGLPSGEGMSLQLERVVVAAGTETLGRRTAAPTLFVAEDGPIGLYENGRLRGGRGLTQGESVLVESGQQVALRNEGNGPVAVLQFSLQARFLDHFETSHSYMFPGAQDFDPDDDPDEGSIRQPLALGEVGSLPDAELSLALVCVRWTEPAPEPLVIGATAPVGLLVLHGTVLVNGEERVEAGACWLSPANTVVGIEAGDPLPDVLLFGALPADGPAVVGTGPGTPVHSSVSSLPCDGSEPGSGQDG